MSAIKFLLRWYSYLFHLSLAVILFALGAFATLEGVHNLNLAMLPWTGKPLTNWLLYGNLAGIAVILLAVTGKLRYLFPVWSLAILAMTIRGFFLSGYTYEGADHFRNAAYFTLAALLAFLGSLTVIGRQKSRR